MPKLRVISQRTLQLYYATDASNIVNISGENKPEAQIPVADFYYQKHLLKLLNVDRSWELC